MKKRFYFILGLATILCLFLVIAVSYFSLKAVEKTKTDTALIADLREMSNDIDSDYYTLLQVSQQMMSTGSIGDKFNKYLTADSQYDRIDLYREFSDSVNISVIGSRDVLLASYFAPNSISIGGGKLLFSNFKVRRSFDPETIPYALDTNQIRFQVLHDSNISVIDKTVVSVMRPTIFDTGTDAMIYIEAYSDILDSISHRSELQNTKYVFLQLDTESKICYSSSDEFSLGETLLLSDAELVETGDYVGVMQKSQFGFQSVLLMPEVDYRREINYWFLGIAIVIIIAVVIIALTATLLIWLIYRPIKTLQGEMLHFGDGNFDIEEYEYNVEEFKSLFETFNKMKIQISALMNETREQEKQKAQLELDKLYYQINPHFLMNSLNSVHWLAVTNNQPEIDTFISRLNYILGYSLEKTDRNTSLRTEIKSLKMYLDLQKTRYDFDYEIKVDEGDYLDFECARFIMQPLAENAVCHNMDEFGHLWITIEKLDADHIRIVLRDDGKGFVINSVENTEQGKESRKNKGIGIRYIERTLESFYSGKAVFQIESSTGIGTTVTMILPMTGNGENDCNV